MIGFQGTWRDYQAQALEDADAYLADGRFHLVAAPGSGKTLLGLELIRRLGRTALILAPTITIRDQWVDRLNAMFAPPGVPIEQLATTRIDQSCPITVLTYQKLYMAVQQDLLDARASGTGNSDDAAEAPLSTLVANLTGQGPVTLVLDEAHHLRREWWAALDRLKIALPDAIIVALTATPPYDVEPAEWRRYEALCGPIDEDIPIPALVKSGDLAPHQDLIMLSLPVGDEGTAYSTHVAAVNDFLESLSVDPAFQSLLAEHPWMIEPKHWIEQILDDPDLFAAMMTFGQAIGLAVPQSGREILGVGSSPWPPVTVEWLDLLLTALLFDGMEDDPARMATIHRLRADCRRLGVLEGEQVRLARERKFYSALAGSLAKAQSIVDIAVAEAALLGEALRMTILTDQVRIADLPRAAGDKVRAAKLGVVPIFEALRVANPIRSGIGVLSGPLIIVPASAFPELQQLANADGLDHAKLSAMPLVHDNDYVRITATGRAAERLVSLITRLFEVGTIKVLVGTQSLLGEGWDAPSINSLVIASNVGSFMLSNQIRGRALRRDPNTPAKVANIWHLATVADGSSLLGTGQRLGPDIALLARRFAVFEGLSVDDEVIESGIGRLGLPVTSDRDAVEQFNQATVALAGQRDQIALRWQNALVGKTDWPKMRRDLRVRNTPASLLLGDTLENMIILAIGGGIGSAGWAMFRSAPDTTTGGALLMLGGLTLLFAAPRLLKSAWLYFRYGTLERSLEQVCWVVIEALDGADLLQTAPSGIAVESNRRLDGLAELNVVGGTREDERLIIRSVAELLSPIENPRFLLQRRSWLFGRRQVDWHAVPQALGQRREWAKVLAAGWRRRIGRGVIIETRNIAGRKTLLRARVHSLSGAFGGPPDERMVWR